MIGHKLNNLLKLKAFHALYRSDGIWYHNLKKFPGILFDQGGYIIFNSRKEYETNSALRIRKDLNVTGGISSLPAYKPFSEFELELAGTVLNKTSPNSSEEIIRRIREIESRVRNKKLVAYLKKLYNNRCQLCGIALIIGNKIFYSEIHHIIALGLPHNGLDVLGNMVCVCPNCHVLLDFKVIKIEAEKLMFVKHAISPDYVNHHNSLVISRRDQVPSKTKKQYDNLKTKK